MKIPSDVCLAYFETTDVDVHVLHGGKLNDTYSVNGTTVLQRLQHELQPGKVEDYQALTEHLNKAGWHIPEAVTTKNGELTFIDNNKNRWRAYELLENGEPDYQPEDIGRIVGALLSDLKSMNHEPQGPGKTFLPVSSYAEKLARAALPTKEAQEQAAILIADFKKIPSLPEAPEQFCHGDQKLNNMLYKDGKPYSLIDWDMLGISNPWYDIGDFLRSTIKNMSFADEAREQPIDFAYIEKVIGAIYTSFDLGLSRDEFRKSAYRACMHVTNMLALRYAQDYKEESGYFSWDSDRYSSRFEHNQQRAAQLKKLHTQMSTYISQPPQVYVDFDGVLFDTSAFAQKLWDLFETETDTPRQQIIKDGNAAKKDQHLGGYMIREHAKRYGLDDDMFVKKLDTLLGETSFTMSGGIDFLRSLIDSGFKPVVLTYGEEEFQTMKLEHTLRPIFTHNELPQVVTFEPKRHYISKHRVLKGGVLIDDRDEQSLPYGYEHILFEQSSNFKVISSLIRDVYHRKFKN